MRYRHSGREMYLDRNGDIRRLTGYVKVRDRLRGFLAGLLRFKVDHFSDDSIDRYIEYILRANGAAVDQTTGSR